MILTISNEVPFQILSSSFSIGPSQTGYELQVGADSRSFSTLFSVGANTPRMVTNVANGSYFRLKNNVGDVKVNWQRVCVDEGGSGSGTELTPIDYFPLDAEEGIVVAYNGPASATGVYQYDGSEWIAVGVDDLSAYWTSAETKDYVDTAVSGIDLSNYYTKSETDSAITAVEDHIYDVEQVTASALTELHNDILELSGSSVDLSGYYTSGETDAAISAATAGKANAANITGGLQPVPTAGHTWFPVWNKQGIITGTSVKAYNPEWTINGRKKRIIDSTGNGPFEIYAPVSAGTAGEVLVSTGSGAPVWSAMTFPTPDVDKAYVDSAITEVQEQIDTMDDVVSAALVDLNTRKVESTSVSTIWKGTAAEYDATTQSGATADPTTLYIIVNNS